MTSHRFSLALLFFVAIFFVAMFPKESTAQVYVVNSDDAKFMDGPKVLGTIARGSEIYVLEKKGEWFQAVNPESKQRAWIPKSKLKLKAFTKAEFAELDRLDSREDVILGYVNASSTTTVQLQETIQWANQLRALWGDNAPRVATAVEYAGIVARRNQAFAVAKSWLDDALQIHLSVYGKDSPKTAEVHLSLADLYIDTGDLADSLKQAKVASQIYRTALGAEHVNAARALTTAARAMEQGGLHENALGFYEIAYRIYQKKLGDNDLSTLHVRATIARQMVNLDRKAEGISEYEAVIKLVEQEYPDKLQFLAMKRLELATAKLNVNNKDSIRSFQEALRITQRDFPDQSVYVREERKKLIGLLLAKGDIDGGFQETYGILKELRYRIRKELWGLTPEQQLGQLEFAEGYTFHQSIALALDFSAVQSVVDMSAEWMINAKGLIQEAQSIQASSALDLKRRDAWADEDLVKLQQLKNAIPKGAVYVDIMQFRDFDYGADLLPKMTIDRYAAWITRPTGDVRFLDLGPADAIDQAIENLQSQLIKDSANIKQLKDERDTPAIKELLRPVSELLWKPILANIGDTKAVIVSPDQATWMIPWAALLNEDGSYVVETHQIQLALSGREFIQSSSEGKSNQSIIFADPNFGSLEPRPSRSRDGALTVPLVGPLEYSSYEASVIKEPLEVLTGMSPRVLMNDRALESEFKRLDGPQVLVVSTHGFSQNTVGQVGGGEGTRSAMPRSKQQMDLEINPLLQCGLMLAGANQHQSIDSLENDGVLTGVEIASTNLRGTKLAVLSACQTGLGDLQSTGGVVGLRRAFHVAGANSVLASLWDVPDRDTANLIRSLFKGLADSRNVAAALQIAQQGRIDRRRKNFGAAHPVFWAAFTLTGNAEF